jgi:predicted alpha/beta hydrolase family esterase
LARGGQERGRTLVVASRDDPMCAFDRARQFARAWGAKFHDLAPARHIDVAARFGPWPELRALLASLTARHASLDQSAISD